MADAYYLMGLGYSGNQQEAEAQDMFAEAVRLNINHVWADKYLSGEVQ